MDLMYCAVENRIKRIILYGKIGEIDMIKTGLIRRFDDLGRIVVPKEVRKQAFGKTDLTSIPMEFFYEKDGTIIIKPVKETDMN